MVVEVVGGWGWLVVVVGGCGVGWWLWGRLMVVGVLGGGVGGGGAVVGGVGRAGSQRKERGQWKGRDGAEREGTQRERAEERDKSKSLPGAKEMHRGK